MACCTNKIDLGEFQLCPGVVTVAIPSIPAGNYEMVFDGLNGVCKTALVDLDGNITFDTEFLHANRSYKFSLVGLDGTCYCIKIRACNQEALPDIPLKVTFDPLLNEDDNSCCNEVIKCDC